MRTDIKKNDEVQVITGKDRGKRGRVVNVLPKKNRVMVEGVARATKHTRPSRKVQQGGIIQQELFIDLSNVQLVCRSCGKPTRIGHTVEAGVKARVCKRCGAEI
jgi:large subunit ribosomal protein L24